MPRKKLPNYLENVKLSKRFRDTHQKHISNWQALYRHLLDSNPNEEHYKKLMLLELERKEPRLRILTRLHGSMVMLRSKREKAELAKLSVIGGQGKL